MRHLVWFLNKNVYIKQYSLRSRNSKWWVLAPHSHCFLFYYIPQLAQVRFTFYILQKYELFFDEFISKNNNNKKRRYQIKCAELVSGITVIRYINCQITLKSLKIRICLIGIHFCKYIMLAKILHLGWTLALKIGMKFLLHKWYWSCYFCKQKQNKL